MARLIFTISSLLVGVTGIVLVLILLRYGSKKVHYILALFNLTGSACWGIGAFLVGMASNSVVALIYWKLALVGGILAPIVFYHVIVLLAELKRGRIVVLFYTYGLIFYLLMFFDLAGLRITLIYDSLYYIKATDYRWFVLVFIWTCILCYALLEMFKLFRNSIGYRHTQYRYLLVGFVTGFTGALLDTLPFFGINIFPFGNILIFFYCILVTYAIFRHNALDIEVIVKKTLVFAGLFAAVYVVFAFFALLGQLFFEKFFTANRWIAMLPSVVIVTIMLRPLESFLLISTNKFLFQKKYDYKELLKTFTGEVLTVLDLDRLVHLTVDKLVDIIKLNSCAVLLFDDEKQQFEVSAGHNLKDAQIALIRPDGIVTFLEQTHGYLLKKELSQKKIFIPESIQEIIDKLNAELIIPMVLHQKVIGILSLGSKKSDEDYTQDDLDILLPLTRTLAIAISNAELFVELGKTQAEAAQKEKMAVIGTLSAGMAHEIRNPITTIKTFSEFLKEKKDDPEFRAKFERLVPKEVEKINYMIEHLLEFSRPADYKVIEPVNLREETKEVIEILQNEMVVNDIMLDENVRELPPISANKKYVQEIVFNLLRNAIHAIGRGGKVSISAEDKGEKVEMEVKDTGCGMSEEQMAHIFQPFYTTKMNQKGVGLGLYIIKQLMNRMGGQVSVESSKGCGTAFRLEFAKYRSV